jgi:hypothetical protein
MFKVPPKLIVNNKNDDIIINNNRQEDKNKINVNENTNITLKCDVYGKPKPTIYWYMILNKTKLIELINFKNQTNIDLLINYNSTNEYECVADNGIQPILSKKIYLNIKCNLLSKLLIIISNSNTSCLSFLSFLFFSY